MEPLDAIAALSPWEPGLFGLFAFTLAIFVTMGLMLVVTSRLGDKISNPEKPHPYESGIIPTGSARLRYPVPFFLVAVFFLIFDVEGAFIFSWAVAAQTLGWKGWLQMAFFIFVLFCGLVYIWCKGGLDWGGKTRIE